MADDWIKMRTALCTDPRIDEIASILNGSDTFRRALCRNEGDPGPLRPTMLRHLVVGAMHAFWTRMQEITVSGNVPQVSPETMDECLDIPGLTDAMAYVGWLEATDDGGMIIPNWEAHNSESAKKRALEARKKRLQRQKGVPQVSPERPASVPGKQGPEKRREEKKKENAAHSPPPAKATGKTRKPRPPDPIWDKVVAIWFPSGVSPTDRARIGKVVRDLKAHKASADDIEPHIRRYRAEWPDKPDTPEAIAKHWDRFAEDKVSTSGIDTSWCQEKQL